ncbi:MAG: hypothetical protein LM576_06950, partial [Thermofilum sp.]|nr:hypothetical protein [Thermofilum sp.]
YAQKLNSMLTSYGSVRNFIEKVYYGCLNEIRIKNEIRKNPLKILELREQNIIGYSTSCGKKLSEGNFYGIYSYIDNQKAQLILYSPLWQKAFYMRLKFEYLRKYLRIAEGNVVTCMKINLRNVSVYDPFSRIKCTKRTELRIFPVKESEISSVLLKEMAGIHASPSFLINLLTGNSGLDTRYIVPVPRYPDFPSPLGDFAIPLVTLVKLRESIASPQTTLNIGGRDVLVEVPHDARIVRSYSELYAALLMVRPITREVTLIALAPSPYEELNPSLDSKWDYGAPSVNEIISEAMSHIVIKVDDFEKAMKIIENIRKIIKRRGKVSNWKKYKQKIRDKILKMIYIFNESDRFKTFDDYYNNLTNDMEVMQIIIKYGYIYAAIHRILKRQGFVKLLNPKFANLLLTYF